MTGTAKLPQTVAQLLYAAMDSDQMGPAHKLGASDRATAFEFDGLTAEPWPFALRTAATISEARGMLQRLPKTTSLTPPDPMLGGINVGQPLLKLILGHNTLVLHVRQPGKSLVQWSLELGARQGYSRIQQGIAMLEPLLRHNPGPGDKNPLLPIFDDAYRLTYGGFEPDTMPGNIMFDRASGKLGLVDQLTYPGTRGDRRQAIVDMGELRNKLLTYMAFPYDADQEIRIRPSNDAEVEHYRALRQSFIELLDDAKTRTAARYEKQAPAALIFKTVKDTKGVTVGDPPKQLLLKLQQLQAHLAIPQR